MKLKLLLIGTALALTLAACSAPGGMNTGMENDRGASTSSMAGSTAGDSMTGEAGMAGAATVITAEQAHARMASGDPVVVVDVRTAEEYAEQHIPGAILLPNEEIGTERPAVLPVLNSEILVYCRSGNRSAQAAKKLVDMGYTNVYDFGGIKDWAYETEAGAYEQPAKEGTMTSFSTYDVNGVPRDETVFAGHKLTMVNIWGTFCGPCLSELPELGQLNADYAAKGVQVVGMVLDVPVSKDGTYPEKGIETAQSLIAQTGASYLHLLPSADLIKAKLGSANAVPETIFVDSEGNQVGESYLGARSGEAWAAIIDELLPQVAA